MLRIGHKGADALVQGNTLESFAAAVEAGVDAIEFDVLRPRGDFDQASDWRRAPAGPGRASGPLLVAHDWGDASRRRPLTLEAALDALAEPPFERLRFDLDLKVAGREDEVVAALAERDLMSSGDGLDDGARERRLPARRGAGARPRLDPAEGQPRLVARARGCARSSWPARPRCAPGCRASCAAAPPSSGCGRCGSTTR